MWNDKSATNSILNVAPGISVGINLVGKNWVINVIGTKVDFGAGEMSLVKNCAEMLLRERLSDASKNLESVALTTGSPVI
jgi:hypothetical protein